MSAQALTGSQLAGGHDEGVGVVEANCALGLEVGSAWGRVRGMNLDCWP